MKTTLAILAISMLATLPALAQDKPPTEVQCRNAVNAATDALKGAPARDARDRQRTDALIQRVEKLVGDNRARGVSECQTWAELNRIASSQ